PRWLQRLLFSGRSGTCDGALPAPCHQTRRTLYELAGARVLMGKHALQFGLVGFVCNHRFSEPALLLRRLRGQDMACKGMPAYHLAGARFLEPLGRSTVGF